ncbi:hypothetical protein [Leptolyngbya sp. FACHB-541]
MPGIELFSARLFRHSFTKHVHETYTVGIAVLPTPAGETITPHGNTSL